MLRNLKDAWGWIERIVTRLERLESGAQLGNSSITKGRLRFIGGLLRVDSGGRVEIVGTLNVEGTSQFIGPVTISGPWTFSGDGDITGDVDISGDLDLTGSLEVLGGGRIKVGNVIITPGSGGRVTVGTGSAQVVLDGATGKVMAGDIVIDPTKEGGAVDIGDHATIVADDAGDGVEVKAGNWRFRIGSSGYSLMNSANNEETAITAAGGVMYLTSTDIRVPILRTAQEGDLDNLEWVARHKTTRQLYVVPPGMGGPLGGPLEFPFSLTLVTSEFGMRDHPDGTGPRMHEGMDFAPPAGTPIPAAGSGVVASSGFSTGYGNEVWIDHGMIRGQRVRTHYAHMQAPGVATGTSLGKGAIVGLVGNTGESFGAHLHFEVEVDGVKVNPRDYISE